MADDSGASIHDAGQVGQDAPTAFDAWSADAEDDAPDFVGIIPTYEHEPVWCSDDFTTLGSNRLRAGGATPASFASAYNEELDAATGPGPIVTMLQGMNETAASGWELRIGGLGRGSGGSGLWFSGPVAQGAFTIGAAGAISAARRKGTFEISTGDEQDSSSGLRAAGDPIERLWLAHRHELETPGSNDGQRSIVSPVDRWRAHGRGHRRLRRADQKCVEPRARRRSAADHAQLPGRRRLAVKPGSERLGLRSFAALRMPAHPHGRGRADARPIPTARTRPKTTRARPARRQGALITMATVSACTAHAEPTATTTILRLRTPATPACTTNPGARATPKAPVVNAERYTPRLGSRPRAPMAIDLQRRQVDRMRSRWVDHQVLRSEALSGRAQPSDRVYGQSV